ncbi:uncharacterized protein LOC131283087 [Anopheles ziemanni]|uniref:uncharacterized protein LOC131283087 n=1 Tax=Anopheles ziemanni TaxID=345580 RepID=UPI00265E8935|nr:uncharacterized protein LOC131283087 [Anopheles ziemanni]
MASTVHEPDLFNDVEIMEISEFNTENDDNYVSVELLSENEEEEVSLSAGAQHEINETQSNPNPPQPEEDRYAMPSESHHQFLSDHQYLVGTSMHHIAPPEGARDQISMPRSERFTVSYDMDIRTQDLFNKESQSGGASHLEGGKNGEELNNNIAMEDADYRICKIEIEDPIFQESNYEYLDCVAHEEIMADDDGAVHESDEDDGDTIVKGLINGMSQVETDEMSPADYDHSYTSFGDNNASRNGDRRSPCTETDQVELVQLHTKGDEQTRRTSSDEIRSETDSLSVILSTNCSERLENDGGIASSVDSLETVNEHVSMATVVENGTENGSADTDCVASRTNEPVDDALDQLLRLGDHFAKQCEQWLEKNSVNDKNQDPAKMTRLQSMLETINCQYTRTMSTRLHKSANGAAGECRKAEIAIQTDHSFSERKLNAKYRKKMLASSGENSSLSESEESSHMMSDFMRRRQMRSAKDNQKKSRDSDAEGRRCRKQIYTDSSSESDAAVAKGREGNRVEADDGDLSQEGLSDVDDIMLNFQEILPAAEDIVQDYLEKADLKKQEKKLSTMTEAELEQYNEDQEDKEIERLCNISYLAVGRSTTAVVPTSASSNKAKAKELQPKKQKELSTMDDFLKEESSDATAQIQGSDNSDISDKEETDTEEQFLQKINDNMKHQLLNQSSSSSYSVSSDDDEDVKRKDLSRDSNEDSDDSNDSIMDSFLKQYDARSSERKDWTKKYRPTEGESEEMDKIKNGDTTEASLPESQDEEKAKDGKETNSVDKILVDSSIEKEDAKTPFERASKVELADPKDRVLFSRKVFEDGDDKLHSESKPAVKRVKVKRRKKLGNLDNSDSDLGRETSSADSDLELLNDSPMSRKRKRNPSATEEPFDFNEPLLSNSNTRKESQSNSGSRKEQPASQTTAAKTANTTTTITTVASPSATGESSTSTKQKSSTKDDQDCISLSSESDADTEVVPGDLEDTGRGAPLEAKRKIRAMLTNDELAEETKKAQKEEEGRVSRLKKKHEQLKKFLQTFRPRDGESELVLDYDSGRSEAICVHPDIVKLLKPHQIEGIKFMYDNTYGSVEALPKHPGSGCILAHCMGLGKTLQMIALLHTVMRYQQLLTRRVLVICPKSTVMNWKEEIIRWQGTIRTGHQMRVFCFGDVCTQDDKISVLKKWFSCSAPNCGVMLIGYEAFRALINYERRKRPVELPRSSSSKLERIKEYLLNPGADLVICDEGHQIKNKRSAISEAVSKIKTKRRIMLTGTPIQNNLKEYYCMVNFIKPSFLGSDKEFSNLYANPIKNGQCKDSDQRAIKIMKQRSYVLHNKLSKFVQRKEAAVLKEFLPEKYEYVLFVPLTPVQEKMYEVFLQMNEYTSSSTDIVGGEPGKTKKFKLIADYTSLRKIWTHPKVLEKAWETAILEKNRRENARKTSTPDTDDDSPDDKNDIASGQLSVTNDWWRQYLQVADLESLFPSNKLWIMFEILKQCNERGEKCLIFSAFVAVLNVVEHFMAKIHQQASDPQQSEAFAYSVFKGPWEAGKDYYRLDGKTHKTYRHKMITSFNDPRNTRTKCFLISAKAGGQGINLTGANRVIILDTSWNPSNDQQNIFRIFRLGQKRKCYVYRLLAMGTMEEKVYSRSVTKQALSFRVVDEQQIDRHYSYGELAELYTLTKVSEMTRETPILPADDVLALLLRLFPNKIFKYHEHDSLLENKPEQDLSEEEKKEAWAAYEREIQTNENRSLMSAWGSMSQGTGAMGWQPPFRMMDYYNNLAAMQAGPSMIGGTSGGDLYRTEYSFTRAMYNAYAQQQQYSLLNDSPYQSILSKSPYGAYSGALDFGASALLNGQPGSSGSMGPFGGGGKPYDPSILFQYGAGGGSGGSSTNMPPAMGSSQSSLPPLPSTSPLAAAGYNGANSSAAHLHALKQMSEYNALNSVLHNPAQPSSTSMGPTISSIASLAGGHKPSGLPTSSISSSVSTNGSSTANVLSMLNEQTKLLAAASGSASFASAGLSSPFSPRNVPLLPPTIESSMRSFMGTAQPKVQPTKTSSSSSSSSLPKTQPTMVSQHATNSSSNTVITSSPSTARSTPGLSSVITTAISSTPKITSVTSMAPRAMNLDLPNNRLPLDVLASKTVPDSRSNKNTPTPVSVLPPSTTISLGPAPVKKTIAPAPARTSSSPTIIPSDDDDNEEDVTNKIAQPHVIVRNVNTPTTNGSGATSGGDSSSKSKKELENRATAGGNIGIVYSNPKTQPSKPPSIGIKDVLKNAKSLTNLTQPQQQQSKLSPSPLLRITKTGSQTPTPPPIIPTPENRPFQKFVRANSATAITGNGSNQQQPQQQQSTMVKTVLDKAKRQSPLPRKLLPSTLKPVQQPTQIAKAVASAPVRNAVTTGQQQKTVLPKPGSSPTVATTGGQVLKTPTVASTASTAYRGQTAPSTVTTLTKAAPAGFITITKPQLSTTVVTRPAGPSVAGSVAASNKPLQKYVVNANQLTRKASPVQMPIGKASPGGTGSISAASGLPKTTVINPANRTARNLTALAAANNASNNALNRLATASPSMTVSRVAINKPTGGRATNAPGASVPSMHVSKVPEMSMTVIHSNVRKPPAVAPTTAASNIITVTKQKPAIVGSIGINSNRTSDGGMTITKATASPTIRQILPSHITVKNTSTASSATSVNAAASGAVLENNGKPSTTANVVTASSAGAPARPLVSMVVRAAPQPTTTSTLPVGQFQSAVKNNVYIRKRKNETILPADVGVKAKQQGPILVNDVRPEVIVPAKRAKMDEVYDAMELLPIY